METKFERLLKEAIAKKMADLAQKGVENTLASHSEYVHNSGVWQGLKYAIELIGEIQSELNQPENRGR